MSGPPKDLDDDLDFTETPERSSALVAKDADEKVLHATVKSHGEAIAQLERRMDTVEQRLALHKRLIEAARRMIRRIIIFLKQGI